METWQIILIVLLAIFIGAPLIGAVIGKQIAKSKESSKKSVLKSKEKVIYLVSIVIGLALLVTGVLLPKVEPEITDPAGMEELGENGENVNGGAAGRNNTTNGGGIAFSTDITGGVVVMG